MGDDIPTRAITLWEPWASAIARGNKRIENRTWKPPKTVRGKRIAIHAGKSLDEEVVSDLLEDCLFDFASYKHFPGHILCTARVSGVIKTGGIFIGPERIDAAWFGREPELTDRYHFEWLAPQQYGWVLTDVRRLAEPVEVRGHQGVWIIDDEIRERMEER